MSGTGFESLNTVLKIAQPRFFNFDYPIYNEANRKDLERKIIVHYYTQEIGSETVALFKLRLYSTLIEIMPEYEQLFRLQTKGINLFNIDITKKMEKEANEEDATNTQMDGGSTVKDTSESKTDAVTDTRNQDLFSDTPQGTVEGLETGLFMTDARIITNNLENHTSQEGKSNSESTNTNKLESKGNKTNKENWIETTQGFQGISEANAIKEFRSIIINIDKQIIKDLEPLFMSIY